jgi:transcriptional regulator with XRE-family HTH domain
MTPTGLKNLRRDLGVTQAEMASLMGLSGGHIIRRFEMAPERKSHASPKGVTRTLYILIAAGAVTLKDLQAARDQIRSPAPARLNARRRG